MIEFPTPGRGLAVLVLLGVVGGQAVAAQQVTGSRWRVGIGGGFGVPHGWVQVRERTIDGTRLDFRRDLGVRRDHFFDIAVEYRPRPNHDYGITVSSWALRGTAILPANVNFNGTTLAGGSALETHTDFPNFIRVDIEGWRRVSRLGDHGTLAGSLGLTAVLLTYRMNGTEAPNSVGHETKEDFVTQELPVPVLGLKARYPLGDRVALSAALSGGYLPWVNSLRREGGEVRISQWHGDLNVGTELTAGSATQIVAGVRLSDFTQREKSREDGNDVHLRSTLLVLGITRGF